MKTIIVAPNKRWSDLTARERTPFVLRGILQVALLAAALTENRGSRWLWSVVALGHFMGIGPIAYFAFGRKHA